MFEKTQKGFAQRTFSKAIAVASSLFLFAAFVPQFIMPAHAAPGLGTATIEIGTGANAGAAAYGAPGTTGAVTVGTKSYVRLRLTVGAGGIAPNQNNVTFQINPNLFPATTWDTAKEAAATDLDAVGEWFVTYFDTDNVTTNNAGITFNASAALNTGLITIQANQQMDATDVLIVYGVVQDNTHARAATSLVTSTDDTGGTPVAIVTSPTVSTTAATAVASIVFSNPFIAATGNTTVNLALPLVLDAADTIDITFPSYIDISDVDAAVTGTLESNANITCVAVGQVLTCTTDGATLASGTIILTGITASNHGSVDATLEVEDEGTPADDIAIDSSVDMTDIAEGGGSGGGGGNEDVPNNDQNVDTPEDVDVITQDEVVNSSVVIDEDNVTDNADDTVTVKITEDATLTLKPSENATVWMMIPEFTSLTAKSTWDRKINPPLVKEDTMIDLAGEKINGTSTLLMREDVETLVDVASNVMLDFDKMLTVNIPVDLTDGTKVKVYTLALDGTEWMLKGTMSVKDKAIQVMTDKPAMFAVVKEVVVQTPEEDDKDELPAENPAEDPLPPAFVSPFADIKGHWAEAYINKLAEMKVVNGKTSTIFAPDDNATRCEVTKIVLNSLGITVNPIVTVKPFDDVELTHWCAPYAAAAKEAGIVEGIGGNKFAPDQLIDRAQALTIFIRAGKFGESTAISAYPDVKAADWYKGFVMKATELNIVDGYSNGNFGPADKITRSQIAKIAVETMNNL